MAKKRRKCAGKGSAFERGISNQLSLWVTESHHPDVFWRAATSGGRATQRAKKGGRSKFQSGDLCAVDPIGAPLLELFTVECKNVKEITWATTMGKAKGNFGDFWKQAVDQCVDSEPLLICKENRQQILVFTTLKGFKLLAESVGPHKELIRTIAFPYIGAHGFLLRDLVLNVSYKTLIKVARKKGLLK